MGKRFQLRQLPLHRHISEAYYFDLFRHSPGHFHSQYLKAKEKARQSTLEDLITLEIYHVGFLK